jgi:tetratricopeptide (TPR) repeat protein
MQTHRHPTALFQALPENDSPTELIRRIVELGQQGKFKEAVSLAEKLVILTKRAKGDEDHDSATCLNYLAVLYKETGNYAKAEPLLQQTLRTRQKVLGAEHPDMGLSLNDLAGLYYDMGRLRQSRNAPSASAPDLPQGVSLTYME